MLKLYQIFYNEDFYTRGAWRQASGNALGLSESTWIGRKGTWTDSLNSGDVSEILFLVTQVDVETGVVTILENSYGCVPLKTKRVINVQAKQDVKVTDDAEDIFEEIEQEDSDD